MTDDIDHTEPSDAAALDSGGGIASGAAAMAVPNADERFVGGAEGGDGFGDGGGARERPQRRLGETEVGYGMCQQAHCHAIQSVRNESKQEEMKKMKCVRDRE